MNKPSVRTIRGSDFNDLETWWNELGEAINLLADFDFLSKHNPVKFEALDPKHYRLTLYEDNLDGVVYGTKDINVLTSDTHRVTIQIGEAKEIWQITNADGVLRKEKVNA